MVPLVTGREGLLQSAYFANSNVSDKIKITLFFPKSFADFFNLAIPITLVSFRFMFSNIEPPHNVSVRVIRGPEKSECSFLLNPNVVPDPK